VNWSLKNTLPAPALLFVFSHATVPTFEQGGALAAARPEPAADETGMAIAAIDATPAAVAIRRLRERLTDCMLPPLIGDTKESGHDVTKCAGLQGLRSGDQHDS